MGLASAAQMLAEAQAIRSKDPKRAEDLYRRILETSAQAQGSQAEREANLRDQETALISLGELYRDNKCVYLLYPSKFVADVGMQRCEWTCASDCSLSVIHVDYCESQDCETQ